MCIVLLNDWPLVWSDSHTATSVPFTATVAVIHRHIRIHGESTPEHHHGKQRQRSHCTPVPESAFRDHAASGRDP
jgi:hypothetical protein